MRPLESKKEWLRKILMHLKICSGTIVNTKLNCIGCKDKNQDGPLNMDALNMLHADAVKFGSGAKVKQTFISIMLHVR